MKNFSTPAIIIILIIIAGCYYDNEEALYPGFQTCDTSNVTFTGSVIGVLNNNCLSCHSDANSSFGGGIRLQKYADVKANSQKIIPAVDGTGPKPMPPNGRLSNCGISIFKIWVRKGMPE